MRISRFVHDLCGQDLIEYALLASMVGLSAVATMPSLAADVASTYGHLDNTLVGSVPKAQTPASTPPRTPGEHADGGDQHR